MKSWDITDASYLVMKFKPEKFKIPEKREQVPEDYWFKIAEKLAQESGEIPDSGKIRAESIIKALGAPSGPYSTWEKPKERETEEEKVERIERSKIITEYLTNKPGVIIDEKTGIFSSDFRDLYPEGLPEELAKVLDPATRTIMETEYRHALDTKKKFGDTKKQKKADYPIHYFRLPGGIDLFLRGYMHDKEWQKNHGNFLKEINKKAKVICIEGFPTRPYGTTLDLYWSNPESQDAVYDALMHEAVESGFEGFFTEIDARDISKIKMDVMPLIIAPRLVFPKLSPDFFNKYLEYLQKEFPSMTKIVSSPKKLKENLIAQSTTKKGIGSRRKIIYQQGKGYFGSPYLSKEGKTSFEPTYLELGQYLFSDALSAIKLHLIAKLMTDGYIEKGPIIDYPGVSHLLSKTFFLKYPQYAMEVVLRCVNELMAGKVENLPEIYKVFENPNWPEIIKEISRLVFKKPEDAPEKPVEIGPNQRKLLDFPIDFLKIYQINPEKVIPSDEKIKEIREKLARV